MTRDQWIEVRQSGRMSMDMLWEYYNESCEDPLINDFLLFQQLFQMFQPIGQPDFHQMFEFYDKKFNINILKDKNNNIIKVY